MALDVLPMPIILPMQPVLATIESVTMETAAVPLWQENKDYLDSLTAEARQAILSGIAEHYGITCEKAYEEVTASGAETLLDYQIEPIRSATLIHMRLVGKLPHQLAQLMKAAQQEES